LLEILRRRFDRIIKSIGDAVVVTSELECAANGTASGTTATFKLWSMGGPFSQPLDSETAAALLQLPHTGREVLTKSANNSSNTALVQPKPISFELYEMNFI